LVGLVTVSLATALACGATGAGCSSSSSGGFDVDSGSADSSTAADTSTADTGSVADVVSEKPTAPQLAAPTFTPAGPASVEVGSTTTVNPPADLPMGGTMFYTTDGTVPNSKTSTLYLGPVQLNGAVGATETVIAIAHDPAGNFADSVPGIAVYTFEGADSPTLGVVTFNPTAGSQNNDFVLDLSSTGGTVCYTIGSTSTVPTCNAATGACTGTSQTYGGGIKINGTVTNASGSITVTAIACEAGSGPSAPVAQAYQLIVSDPTMVLNGVAVPATTGTANVPWPTGQAGVSPSIGTLTSSSITVNDPVTISYSTTPGGLTCATGAQGGNPTAFNGAAGEGPLQSTSTTYQAMGCKQGYQSSNIVTFPVTIQLNPPVLVSATNPYNYELDMVAAPAAAGTDINDAANNTVPPGTTVPPSGEILCATADGTAAGCVVNAGVATCTGTATAAPKVTKTGATVNVVACAPGLTTSQPATATYTLQLAPPFLASSEATGSGLGKPGWSWATTGLPILSMAIPVGASTAAPNGYPYADGQKWQVNQVQALPCTGTANAPEPGASYPPPSGCTGPAYFAADYYCWSLTATPACGTTAGTCSPGTPKAVTASTTVLPGGATGAGVTATSTLQIIACDNDAVGEDVFAPSTVTKIVF
jgi:hypothetical protein